MVTFCGVYPHTYTVLDYCNIDFTTMRCCICETIASITLCLTNLKLLYDVFSNLFSSNMFY